MPKPLLIVIIAVGSYLFGNINTALIIARLKGQNLRKSGSGNPGTMNMVRTFGTGLGALTLLLDALKGCIPCIVGQLLLDDRMGLYLGGLCVIIGHIFPVALGFRGGKGIASTIGICIWAHPQIALPMLLVGTLFMYLTKIGATTSFIVIGPPLVYEMMIAQSVYVRLLVLALYLLTLFAHRRNIAQLFANTDKPVAIFGRK